MSGGNKITLGTYCKSTSFSYMLGSNDMKTMRLAISYVRWSTPEQRLGDSKRRQVLATEEYCREHNLLLDQQLVDSGLSAYSGKHRREGSALSSFLKDIETGKVPKGAVLVVESLDRLTRQAIPEALELFLGIIRSGIDIVTLIDKQWYSRETIGEVQNLMVSIISLWRSHEDSRHKGERVGKAWLKKRELAVEGGVPMTAACPGWIRLHKISKTERCYELIPERAKKVRLIFWLTLRGWGAQRIAKLFNRHQLPPWGVARRQWGDPKKRQPKEDQRGWHPSYIKKILSNRAVLGEFVPHTVKDVVANQGKLFKRHPVGPVLKNYYPRVISSGVFATVQQRRSGPRGPVGRRIANLFQGMLKDGDHPEYTMGYRDHGCDWRYV